ncbi:type III PLP-dependent enzyme [Aliishimia ponticola]|uniref:ornithine decarboxylase n=1 Tax=Aliishimia ponticola TaxID=2499833 RepID=A0A4S4NDI0_9RHOB|nr:type III PLP-dependent enzyme [Aliishimia ponticola]THH36805.1 type III PLP-dependent enzyme [Aliishimia ponticola]
MTAFQTPLFSGSVPVPARDRSIDTYIAARQFERPTLVLDRALVAGRYDALSQGLGDAHIHYAVKANPEPEIIATLVARGSRFDAASRAEIALCLQQGAKPSDISFGNTVKRASDIAYAHGVGITLFAADSEEELRKIAAHAPGARVYIRLLVEASQADWPLSRKFGCAPDTALVLMDLAAGLGLFPVGVSFHVGSQTRLPEFWAPVLDRIAETWNAAIAAGHSMELLNIGGGFPASYDEDVMAPRAYAAAVMAEVTRRFGKVPYVMAEPGRGLVAEAGHIVAETLLVARKSDADVHRWVYLDIGKFSGLAETMDEAIRYRIETAKDAEPMGPCVLAGPSCDSADVLYENRPVMLPLSLTAGDRVVIRNCGAYTTTYATIGFNGFPPLDVIVL